VVDAVRSGDGATVARGDAVFVRARAAAVTGMDAAGLAELVRRGAGVSGADAGWGAAPLHPPPRPSRGAMPAGAGRRGQSGDNPQRRLRMVGMEEGP
jgi:hypothetical protein